MNDGCICAIIVGTHAKSPSNNTTELHDISIVYRRERNHGRLQHRESDLLLTAQKSAQIGQIR